MTGADVITQTMQDAVEHGVFPGAVVSIRHRGFLVYERAFGASIVEPHREPATVESVYDLASLTKPLATATAILCLIQDGRVGLDDAIGSFFPELSRTAIGAALIRHLLNHCSGLPRWRPIYQWLGVSPVCGWQGSDEQRTARLLQHLGREALKHPIGTRAIYSDLGFILLGLLIERVTGVPLDRYCRDRVYQRIGAKPLFFCFEREAGGNDVESVAFAATERDPWRGRVLRGEVHDENAYALGGVAGHAGLFGSVRAVSRLVHVWLAAWLGSEEFLAPVLVREFTARQNIAVGSSWALGWDTPSPPSTSGRNFAAASFGHLGFTGTSVWVDPVAQLEVVLLSNRVHPTRQNTKIQQFRPLIHDVIYETYVGRGEEANRWGS